jgi:hypothetical protein
MNGDGQLEQYVLVAARLKQAHALLRAARVPDDLRVALTRKLLVITSAARYDTTGAAVRLERFIRDFDDSRFPDPGTE